MSAIDTKLEAMKLNIAELAVNTKTAWNDMMKNATLKALLTHRYEILEFTKLAGQKESNKLATKLKGFSGKLHDIESTELSSKTYVKMLVALKAERELFKTFKANALAKNVTETEIMLIETVAEEMATEQLKAA